MLSKTELYISVGVFIVMFLLICWLVSLIDGRNPWWANEDNDNEVSLSSLSQYSPWLSAINNPTDYFKTWIITQNDFVDGKYIHSVNDRRTNTQRFRGESEGEKECRRVLENMFSKPFPKARPDFLNNSVTSSNLELDCYNEEMKLAVEYQGVQHYKYVPYFHPNKEAFMNQKYRDEMKRALCRQNGITLIEVPYTVPVEEIESYLRSQL